MYTITFYSFKGGVGRSMALVNVGTELARAGKRVLLVDFDLEAPSLTSFKLAAAKSCNGGIVDFVNTYLETGRAPSIRGFVSGAQTFEGGGHLWIMPAGVPSDDYQSRLTRINWLDLYERGSGFLLMEEMKAQWASELRPDYVLIDSRTGHSDVSGICTRQLPDAVAFVFVPNRQNLDGLSTVVRQVRNANDGSVGRLIELFFVESNVPYYDDERQTLAINRRMFHERLSIASFSATLHQHPHLSVLNQSVFVEEFPETSLAGEYRALTTTLRSKNLLDREAVLPQLKLLAKEVRTSGNYMAASDKVRRVSERHGSDPEICFWLGRVSRQLGEDDEATIQFNQAIELGYHQPEAFLQRASLRLSREGPRDEIEKDLRDALDLLVQRPTFTEVQFAIRSLMQIGPDDAKALSELPAVRALSIEQQIDLTYELSFSDKACEFAYYVLKRLEQEDSLESETRSKWANGLLMACIRIKRFKEALRTFSIPGIRPAVELCLNFNRAIAEWAVDKAPPVAAFRAVLQLDEQLDSRGDDPNYLQCIAIAAYVCEEIDRAKSSLERARRHALRQPTFHFSALRYLKVSPREFAKDCDQLSEQIERRITLEFPAIELAAVH